MKVVILAGGLGTRISEESHLKPKPMIEIGGMPIIWHIMKWYSKFGINEFIICAGYKQSVIKTWFANYFVHTSDVTFDFSNGNDILVHRKKTEPWKVTIVDTGLNTQTGGRVKKIRDYIDGEPFFLTYGDAVGDIDINKLLEYHKSHGKLATISVYNFSQNKGVLEINNGIVTAFREKSTKDKELINIGFMVLEPEFLKYIDDDFTVLEKQPMEQLLQSQQLMAYMHNGFWQCMDTMREKEKLESLIERGQAPWIYW